MTRIVLGATLALAGLSLAAPADARGDSSLEKRCKRIVQQMYGVEPGKGRRGNTGGRAGAYYTQIQNCVANGGRV
jgi:hypothetical protein